MILLSHPTANQNVRQTAIALAEAALLAEFWTCVSWQRGGMLDRALGFSERLRSELRRRSFPPELSPFIRTVPWREWGRQLAGQFGWNSLTKSETGRFSIDAVYSSLDRHVARRLTNSSGIKAVYAYDGGALETFRVAKARGLTCIYEHPIIYWRKVGELQREEAQLHPEWAPTLGALGDSAEKLARKDEELALADLVVTPSSFSRASLVDAPCVSAPIRVLPYGTRSLGENFTPKTPNEKLRVLFVGTLSQAKGLGYLLDAVSRLGTSVEFTLIGRRVSNAIPAPDVLEKYRWIPSLAHDELLREMSRHDVLVLPSLHEGFGLVMSEAMSQGLTVITTPNTGGPDLIADGVEGFIVPIRSTDALEEKLALLVRDRDRLAAMQQAAREKAAVLTWENYRQGVAQLAREVMEKRPTP
ncbi:MAG TPA: glycosyltransferase family 4 protein [Chthoniobacterales bacterium]|nr:glycosyltransferase family 4 protein [Chthoniobacterales bacterium]